MTFNQCSVTFSYFIEKVLEMFELLVVLYSASSF